MILKRDAVLSIYKKFNSLMGYSNSDEKVETNIVKLVDIIQNTNNDYSMEEKTEAFTSYMAVNLFRFYSKQPHSLDDLFNDPEFGSKDEESEEQSLIQIADQSSVFEPEGEFIISKEQINALKTIVVQDPDYANSIHYLDQNGILNAYKKSPKNTDKNLNVDKKYDTKFNVKDVLKEVTKSHIENVEKAFDDEFEKKPKNIFSKIILTSTKGLEVEHAKKPDAFKRNYCESILKGNTRYCAELKENRINATKREMRDELALYLGAKKHVKDRGIGRYLNPFNWVRTYRENKFLKEMKQNLTNKYGITGKEWDYLDSLRSSSTLDLNKIKDRYTEPAFYYDFEKERAEIKAEKLEILNEMIKNNDPRASQYQLDMADQEQEQLEDEIGVKIEVNYENNNEPVDEIMQEAEMEVETGIQLKH